MSRQPEVRYAAIQSPVGRGWVAFTDRGVVALEVGRAEAAFVTEVGGSLGVVPRRAPLPSALGGRIRSAIAGDTRAAPVDLGRLPRFQQAVLRCAMRIPPGEVRSYGEVARSIGHPRAARAVGTALARNPIPLLVPCHRVVRGDGTIGRYGMGGERTKRALLKLEGALG